jgi:sec-independent protein translocase protein TatA
MGYFQTPWHIVLLLLIALLLFGGKRLPKMGRALGSGMREFKDAVTGHSDAEQTKLPRPEQGQLPGVEPTTAAFPAASEHKTD